MKKKNGEKIEKNGGKLKFVLKKKLKKHLKKN